MLSSYGKEYFVDGANPAPPQGCHEDESCIRTLRWCKICSSTTGFCKGPPPQLWKYPQGFGCAHSMFLCKIQEPKLWLRLKKLRAENAVKR